MAASTGERGRHRLGGLVRSGARRLYRRPELCGGKGKHAGADCATGRACFWPRPSCLALFMNTGGYFENALLLSAVLGLWIVRCLRHTFHASERNIGRTVSGLLAGIVWWICSPSRTLPSRSR